jgi:hypothetical protein
MKGNVEWTYDLIEGGGHVSKLGKRTEFIPLLFSTIKTSNK